jgi:hypothetical protein
MKIREPSKVEPFEIKLINTTTIFQQPYKTSYREEQIIISECQKMLENDIIELSKSPYSSPIILVKKKDTKDLRPCVDYRKLNAITIQDKFPIPSITNIFDRNFNILIACCLTNQEFETRLFLWYKTLLAL